MEKIIWQPAGVYHEGYDFGVLLDREFAKIMASSAISLENKQD